MQDAEGAGSGAQTVAASGEDGPVAKLECTSGMNKGDQFSLKEGTTVIGRAPDCDIVLFDKKVSRRHCEVRKKGKYCAVDDLQSRHGTSVNGKRITKRRSLKIDDKIRIGRTTMALSDKPVGSFVNQTATEAAADLQTKHFDQLIGTAAADVVKAAQAQHEQQRTSGMKGFLRGLFRKR